MSCFYCTIYAPQIPKTNQKKKKKIKPEHFSFFCPIFQALFHANGKQAHTLVFTNQKQKILHPALEKWPREVKAVRNSLEKATDTGISSPALAPCASLVFGRAHSNYSRSPLASLLVVSFLLGASRHLLHFNVFVTMATRSHDKKM